MNQQKPAQKGIQENARNMKQKMDADLDLPVPTNTVNTMWQMKLVKQNISLS